MSETRSRRAGGRAARQAARLHAHVERVPFLTRTLAPVEVLSEEGVSLIEENADTILERVGIDFRDAPDALELLRDAGAESTASASASPAASPVSSCRRPRRRSSRRSLATPSGA